MTTFEKWAIIATVMLVTVVEVLDVTIVNVALPAMMGSFDASTDQITWIITSYLIAAAVFMPLTGVLIQQLGLQRLLLINVIGFLISSTLCGLANSLLAIIVFRILQGIFGSSLVPISRYVIRHTFERKEQSTAVAIWGIGIMVAPILGPTIGGYITEALNWRWIFYINIPICILAFFMTLRFIKETPRLNKKIDWQGLLLMILAIGSLQALIDRGNNDNWFESNLISTLAIMSLISFILFIYRGWHKRDHIINLQLFTERHFTLSALILSLYSVGLFSSIVLLPILLESLGYPANMIGLVMAPRGLAAILSMLIASRLTQSIDNRILVIIGILITAWGTYQMSNFNMYGAMKDYLLPGVIQGLGLGLVVVPLSSSAFDYLKKQDVAEASGLLSLGRSIGISIGISFLSAILSRQTRINWQHLTTHIQATNPYFVNWATAQQLAPDSPLSLKLTAVQIQQQSFMIGFIDAFLVGALILLLIIPLVFWLKKDHN